MFVLLYTNRFRSIYTSNVTATRTAVTDARARIELTAARTIVTAARTALTDARITSSAARIALSAARTIVTPRLTAARTIVTAARTALTQAARTIVTEARITPSAARPHPLQNMLIYKGGRMPPPGVEPTRRIVNGVRSCCSREEAWRAWFHLFRATCATRPENSWKSYNRNGVTTIYKIKNINFSYSCYAVTIVRFSNFFRVG